jgi:hypothetical protein
MTDRERSYMDWFKVYHEEVFERVKHWGDNGSVGKQWSLDKELEEEMNYGG